MSTRYVKMELNAILLMVHPARWFLSHDG